MSFLVNSFRGVATVNPPAFHAVGALADNANQNLPADVPYPAGLAANDIAVIHAGKSDALNAATITTPAGWTLIASVQSANGFHCSAAYWKRLTGSESGTVTVTSPSTSGGDTLAGVMSVWRGCVASGSPIEDADTNKGTDSSAESPGCTTAGPNRTVIKAIHNDNSLAAPPAIDPGGSWTERYDAAASNPTYDARLELSSREVAAASTVAADTTTVSGSADSSWSVIEFALIPA